MEYCSNGNLFHYIHPKKGMPEKIALKIFHSVCQAVSYLHSNGIAHRDIKPENIVFDKNFNVKLCDFGWACKIKPKE